MRTVETIENEINELKERMLEVKGTDTEVYTRIVGYYRAVKNWNKGKRDEYNHRKLFTQPGRPSLRDTTDTVVSTVTANEAPRTQEPAVSTDKEEPAAYYYFYRTSCPNCPPVRSWLEDFPVGGTFVNVDEKEGFEKAAEFQIFSSPTVVFLNEEGSEMYRATNVNALDSLFSKVSA